MATGWFFFFFSSRRRHTRFSRDWSSDVCSSDLLGPSGSGKSTLLTLFGGIQRPSAGRIFLGDQEISRMSERQLTKVRSSRVSTMLQGATRNLLHYATARQNLRFSRAASADPDRTLGDVELLRRVGLEAQG